MATTESLNNQLLKAAKDNNLEEVTGLLERGAQADYHFHEDGTWGASTDDCPLRWALQNDNLKMSEYLLEKGAKTNDKYGQTDWRGCGRLDTLFSLAASRDNPEFLGLFLRHGADPNVMQASSTHSMRTDGGSESYLLHSLLNAGASSINKVIFLLDFKANVNARAKSRYCNERGFNSRTVSTPLFLACCMPTANDEQHTKKLELIEKILKLGAEVDAINTGTRHDPNPKHRDDSPDDPRGDGFISPVICVQWTETALHRAALLKDVLLVNLLLKYGADVKIPRTDGKKEIECVDLETTDEIKQIIRSCVVPR